MIWFFNNHLLKPRDSLARCKVCGDGNSNDFIQQISYSILRLDIIVTRRSRGGTLWWSCWIGQRSTFSGVVHFVLILILSISVVLAILQFFKKILKCLFMNVKHNFSDDIPDTTDVEVVGLLFGGSAVRAASYILRPARTASAITRALSQWKVISSL